MVASQIATFQSLLKVHNLLWVWTYSPFSFIKYTLLILSRTVTKSYFVVVIWRHFKSFIKYKGSGLKT